MAQVNFRIDDETKQKAEELFASLGLTMSSAITVFIQRSIDFQGIPFTVRRQDAFARPMDELIQRVDDVKHGRNCHFHDLIDVDDAKSSKRSRGTARKASARRRRTAS
ncbi:MAG: type II toxin-antitoxin system RelB/DinJ family antitoxin [Kiritimatiellae bacterium]|nr:type II toxin-antitoxin system RelB/DinJ family antitoxin [Kiritimatiellia bacterium]